MESTVIPFSIFADGSIGRRFQQDGYVVLPLLRESEVRELARIYADLHKDDRIENHMVPSYVAGFFSSAYKNDVDYRRSVHQSVMKVLDGPLRRYLSDFKCLFGGYLVKVPEERSQVPIHQDPCFVDEQKFAPVKVWCPLQDVVEENGAMKLLAGSHRFHRGWRAVTIPSPWRRHEALIKKYMTPVPLPAGSAVLFDHGLIHSSAPNLSDSPRIVVTAVTVHRTAPIRIAYRDPARPDEVELYDQPDDFVITYPQFSKNPSERPEFGRFAGSVPYEAPSISEERMFRLLQTVCREEAQE